MEMRFVLCNGGQIETIVFVLVFVTAHKGSCGKVMSLHLSTSHSVHRRGVYPNMQWLGGVHPPEQTPPRQTPPSRWPLKWAVCILLECILVKTCCHLVLNEHILIFFQKNVN